LPENARCPNYTPKVSRSKTNFLMETRRKRTETTSETATLVVVEKTWSPGRIGRCGNCDAEVIWIPTTEVHLFGIAVVPESRVLHFSGTDICSRSLINLIRNGENI
jgi:hypothetical protein